MRIIVLVLLVCLLCISSVFALPLNDNEFSLLFNGVSDMVEVPDSPSVKISSEMTFTAWILIDPGDSGGTFLEKGNLPLTGSKNPAGFRLIGCRQLGCRKVL